MHKVTSLVSRGSYGHRRCDGIGRQQCRVGAVVQRRWIPQAEHAAEPHRVAAGSVYLVEESVNANLVRGIAELTEGASYVSGGYVLDTAGGHLVYQQIWIGAVWRCVRRLFGTASNCPSTPTGAR